MLVLMKGCPLRCPWCHNPEGQRPERQITHLAVKCTRCGRCETACPLPHKAAVCPNGTDILECSLQAARFCGFQQAEACTPDEKSVTLALHPAARPGCKLCGRCVEACPTGALQMVGADVSVEAILAMAQKDMPFYRASGGGVTVSGGEPLTQPEFVGEFLRQCRGLGIHTAIETCGFVPPEVLERLAQDVNLWLYDVKHVDPAKHERWTGRPCSLILRNLSALVERKAHIVARIPLIPGFNDRVGDVEAIASRLGQLGVTHVELLPFNPSFAAKWQALGRAVQWNHPPTPQPRPQIDLLRSIVDRHREK